MPRKQTASNRFTRENLIGNADSKHFARKHSHKGELEIDPSDRKAALLSLPLKTHVDMVTLTLDNLDVKLAAIGAFGVFREAQEKISGADTMRAQDIELLRRLSERLMQQRERIDRMSTNSMQ